MSYYKACIIEYGEDDDFLKFKVFGFVMKMGRNLSLMNRSRETVMIPFVHEGDARLLNKIKPYSQAPKA